MVETREERKERTRRAILDAALALCEDSSLVALSLRQVAKQVGIVPTAFYRHFESIEQLGLALVEESFVSLRAVLRDLRRGAPQWESLIDESVDVLVDHVRNQHQHFAFIARERFAGPPTVRTEIGREIRLFERELATDLAHLPGTDTWSEEDLQVLASLLVATSVATVEALVSDVGGRETERRVVATARSQMRMVLVGAANWRTQR